tara:strand:+ start:1749 stop:2636 length:888 start_codon:yes stop_codon:yes gene_type:complete
MAELKGRIYELIIGDYSIGEGILINNLEIRFDVSKSADNTKKANSGVVEVYNLSPESLKMLESDYLEVKFSIGWEETGLQQLLAGNVVEKSTIKEGTDIVTQFILGEGYTSLNHAKVKTVVAPGKTIADVIEVCRTFMPGVARGGYVGTNLNNKVIYGYPMNGTPKRELDRICNAHNLEWRVDNNVLSVSDKNGLVSKDTSLAPLISPATGNLIDIPFHTSGEGVKLPKDKTRKMGVQLRALCDPNIIPGSLIRLESKYITGFYRVNDARYYGDYRGQDWYVDCFCSTADDVELA